VTFPAKQFREIEASNLQAHSLQDELMAHGHVLIRGLLLTDDLHRLLGEITRIVYYAGWFLPDHDPRERTANASAACGKSDPSFKRRSKQLFCLESLRALAHHPALQEAMRLLVRQPAP